MIISAIELNITFVKKFEFSLCMKKRRASGPGKNAPGRRRRGDFATKKTY
jgi:hypothetical protein